MGRNTLNYIVDCLMFLVLLSIAFIGILLRLVIPRGGAAPPASKFLWGLHRHDWGDIHFSLALAFLALLTLHIILHWSWIVNTTRCLFRRRPAQPCDAPQDTDA